MDNKVDDKVIAQEQNNTVDNKADDTVIAQEQNNTADNKADTDNKQSAKTNSTDKKANTDEILFSNTQVKIDYKSPITLYQFVLEGGKINPSRITNLRQSEQRALRNAVKKARRLSLLPACARAYDDFGFPEQISATPFEID